MATEDESPWLRIPAAEYEAHMAEIGQAAALRAIFASVYAAAKPRRLLLLGCTTGGDLELVDPGVTSQVVGVDVNGAYLALARERAERLRIAVDLVNGDVLDAELAQAPFDLVHAALLLEHVEPLALLRRVYEWLSPDGICSIVTQDAAAGIPPVSKTVQGSLRLLEGRMTLLDAAELQELAARAMLQRTSHRSVPLPNGKTFSVSTFSAAPR